MSEQPQAPDHQPPATDDKQRGCPKCGYVSRLDLSAPSLQQPVKAMATDDHVKEQEWWRGSYEEIKGKEAIKNCDGAQMFNGKWWMALFGCDTLDHLIDAHNAALAAEREKVKMMVDALERTVRSNDIRHAADALQRVAKQEWTRSTLSELSDKLPEGAHFGEFVANAHKAALADEREKREKAEQSAVMEWKHSGTVERQLLQAQAAIAEKNIAIAHLIGCLVASGFQIRERDTEALTFPVDLSALEKHDAEVVSKEREKLMLATHAAEETQEALELERLTRKPLVDALQKARGMIAYLSMDVEDTQASDVSDLLQKIDAVLVAKVKCTCDNPLTDNT